MCHKHIKRKPNDCATAAVSSTIFLWSICDLYGIRLTVYVWCSVTLHNNDIIGISLLCSTQLFSPWLRIRKRSTSTTTTITDGHRLENQNLLSDILVMMIMGMGNTNKPNNNEPGLVVLNRFQLSTLSVCVFAVEEFFLSLEKLSFSFALLFILFFPILYQRSIRWHFLVTSIPHFHIFYFFSVAGILIWWTHSLNLFMFYVYARLRKRLTK